MISGFYSRKLIPIALLLFASAAFCPAQRVAEFHRKLIVTNAEPVTLSVNIPRGDIEVVYSRDGEVSISAIAQALGDTKVDENGFQSALSVEQSGNKVAIFQTAADEKSKLRYRIDVPYRTEVVAAGKNGKQIIRGVVGPVQVSADRGDVSVSYVSAAVNVQVERGSVGCQTLGDRVSVTVGVGNIVGERLPNGIHAKTGDGDIALMVVGPSEATVAHGAGRIDVGGARDTLLLSTDAGDLHVRAVPHSGWKLRTQSGPVRLDLPEKASYDLDASTTSGTLQIERDDLPKPSEGARQIVQKVNAGGGMIEVRTASGTIVIR